jgi:hypothetical protein
MQLRKKCDPASDDGRRVFLFNYSGPYGAHRRNCLRRIASKTSRMPSLSNSSTRCSRRGCCRVVRFFVSNPPLLFLIGTAATRRKSMSRSLHESRCSRPTAADASASIEVSDSTYDDDRYPKIPLYVDAGVPAWIVNTKQRQNRVLRCGGRPRDGSRPSVQRRPIRRRTRPDDWGRRSPYAT